MHFGCILGMAMSRAIQIRDVPDDVHAILRARAAAAGMSMSEYLRSELITLASRPTLEEVIARAQARHGGLTREEIVRTIREMRDAGE
jgi:plasmid stability protein